MEYEMEYAVEDATEDAGFHITGCPGQPILPVGQPKVDPWLPDRATKSFAICLLIYVVGQPKCLFGQPKCLVGQPQFDTGCPTGQLVFKTNVKPWDASEAAIKDASEAGEARY